MRASQQDAAGWIDAVHRNQRHDRPQRFFEVVTGTMRTLTMVYFTDFQRCVECKRNDAGEIPVLATGTKTEYPEVERIPPLRAGDRRRAMSSYVATMPCPTSIGPS